MKRGTICDMNHARACPYYTLQAESRGTVIAGWTILSDLRANATRLGLDYETLRQLNKIAADYEVKYDALARKISSLRLKLSKKEMTREEAKSVLKEAISIASKADHLFLEYAYKGREMIPDKVWNKFKNMISKISRAQKITYK